MAQGVKLGVFKLAETKKLFYLYLPLADNDGNLFPEAMFTDVATELSEQFGGSTRARPMSATALLGEWLEPTTGEKFRDDVIGYFVLAPISPETETFFTNFKLTFMKRFRQEDIFLIAHTVEVY